MESCLEEDLAHLSEESLLQLEVFFSSLLCEVHVATTLVEVYIAESTLASSGTYNNMPIQWKLLTKGALILRAHKAKESPHDFTSGTLSISLLPTCETVWSMPLSVESTYDTDSPPLCHIVSSFSSIASPRYRLAFADLSSALSFQTVVLGLLESLRNPHLFRDNKDKKKLGSKKGLQKETISAPSSFRHVSTLAGYANGKLGESKRQNPFQ